MFHPFRRSTVVMLAALLSLLTPLSATGAEPQPLSLFGVVLKEAPRETLRQAAKRQGLKAEREDDRYWVDQYDASGVLEEATELGIGYVKATGRFAYAQYIFESFMDTQQVARIIQMVSNKYGKPASSRGNIGLGEVTVRWSVEKGMRIEVSRGWPETTTYLSFVDLSAYQRMQAEIQAMQQEESRQKARQQNQVF